MPGEGKPHQLLTGDRLRHLFAEVDAEIDLEGSPVEVIICGGAALALRWDERATYDIDALGKFPRSLAGAINKVGSRHGLRPDWFNDAASVFRPEALQTESVYEGQRLHVQAATRPYLLAMKVYAARMSDVGDIERLVGELGMTSSELLPLVREAYDEEMIEAHKNAINKVITDLSKRQQATRDQGRASPGIDL